MLANRPAACVAAAISQRDAQARIGWQDRADLLIDGDVQSTVVGTHPFTLGYVRGHCSWRCIRGYGACSAFWQCAKIGISWTRTAMREVVS